MKLIVESAESWDIKYKVWNHIEKNPLYTRSHETLPLDEQRRLATLRGYDIYRQRFLDVDKYLENPSLGSSLGTAAGSFESTVSVKFGLGFGMYSNVLMSLGTERVQHMVFENQEMKSFGCFALTEIAHGSNTQGMKTTATYDIDTKSFILNTPNFEAAKCWVGNLGKTATHAIVYAQLYTPDGKCHGLNAFVVPIRDQKTMLAFPGVIVGDLGEKVSLNGIDNGFGTVYFN
jgi:acyl-CoA oxidase